MALTTQVNLQLVLTADDQLQSVLADLQAQVDQLTEAFAGLSDAVSGVSDDLEASLTDAADTARAASEQVDTFAASLDTAAGAASNLGTASDAAFATLTAAATEAADTLDATVDAAMQQILTTVRGLGPEAADSVAELVSQLAAAETPFYQIVAAGKELAVTLGGLAPEVTALQESFAEFTAAEEAAVSAAQDLATLMEQMRGVATDDAEALQAFETALQAANDLATVLRTTLGSIGDALPNSALAQFEETLAAANAQAQEMAATVREATATPVSGAASPGLFSGLSGTVMRGGMDALMGYMGLNMLTSAANLPQALYAMMNLTHLGSAQAGQALGVLGVAGLGGMSGVQFLQQLEGSLRTTFTPQIGTGMLSKNAILLQSLGITQQTLAENGPWGLLNTIAPSTSTSSAPARAAPRANCSA
jgi:ABC-type transporter Mla subunit MlaD